MGYTAPLAIKIIESFAYRQQPVKDKKQQDIEHQIGVHIACVKAIPHPHDIEVNHHDNASYQEAHYRCSDGHDGPEIPRTHHGKPLIECAGDGIQHPVQPVVMPQCNSPFQKLLSNFIKHEQ